jgi:hypothetical protein
MRKFLKETQNNGQDNKSDCVFALCLQGTEAQEIPA